jgi:hypothetical protein
MISETMRRVVWPALCLLAGCGPRDEACFGLSQGQALNVNIVAPYTATSAYDFEVGRQVPLPVCAAELTLAPGSQLRVEVVEQRKSDESCRRNTVRVTSGSGLELGDPSPEPSFGVTPPSEVLHASQWATVRGCDGSWGIAVQNRNNRGADADPFVEAPSSGYPPVILHLGFQAANKDAPACAQLLEGEDSCADYYVVELHRP